MTKFRVFVQEGVSGELSRFYISVNDRSHEKTYKALLHYLIDNPNIKLESIAGKVASIASKEENRNSKLSYWIAMLREMSLVLFKSI